jgi:hypothetical protein
MPKASEVFKKIRFAKLDPNHDKGPKMSTDDEEHGTVGELEFDQQLKHVKKRAMQEAELKDACWKGYTAVGMKMKNGKKVPNCVPTQEEVEQIEELSRDTLLSYANKVSLDSQKHSKDPTKRSGEKASRSVDGYAKAHNRLEKPVKEDTEMNEEQKPPFDGPYKTTKGDGIVTDKSGAKHTPMSRVRDLARDAMKKVTAGLPKKKLEESRKADIVRETLKAAKKKKDTKGSDTFQKDPELSSQIIRND